VDRQRVHAAKRIDEIEPVTAVKMQRDFAVRGRFVGELRIGLPELEIVVDFRVRDQRSAVIKHERLTARLEIND
jgi:hypothetical protein